MHLERVESLPFRHHPGTPEGASYSAALVRITASGGAYGWGETESAAPEAVCALIQHLLRHSLEGEEFDGSAAAIARFWHRSSEQMRIQGHTSGLFYDALAALDIALWDLAGKLAGAPVARLLASERRPRVRAHWCGPEDTRSLEAAWSAGFRHFKLHYTGTEHELMVRLDALRLRHGSEAEVAVDARWRLDWTSGPPFGARLDERGVMWLECPLDPENPAWHGLLAGRISTPIAIGQCYHTVRQLEPFFQHGGLRVLQPEVGRTGLSEGIRMARLASSYCMRVAPRAGLSAGPKLAAALHLASAAPDCTLLAYRPDALALSGRLLSQPIRLEDACYTLPDAPGLGIDFAGGTPALRS